MIRRTYDWVQASGDKAAWDDSGGGPTTQKTSEFVVEVAGEDSIVSPFQSRYIRDPHPFESVAR